MNPSWVCSRRLIILESRYYSWSFIYFHWAIFQLHFLGFPCNHSQLSWNHHKIHFEGVLQNNRIWLLNCYGWLTGLPWHRLSTCHLFYHELRLPLTGISTHIDILSGYVTLYLSNLEFHWLRRENLSQLGLRAYSESKWTSWDRFHLPTFSLQITWLYDSIQKLSRQYLFLLHYD